MPNWCNNILYVTGPKKDIKALNDIGFSLQKLVPCPKELLDTVSGFGGTRSSESKAHVLQEKNNIAKYGYKNWYDWNISKWGTKWDPGPAEFTAVGDKDLEVYFDSAWSPPEQGIIEIAKKLPKCKFRLEYIESGCRFVGFLSVKDDNIESEYLEYSSADELEKFIKEYDIDIASGELDYIREMEAEENDNTES